MPPERRRALGTATCPSGAADTPVATQRDPRVVVDDVCVCPDPAPEGRSRDAHWFVPRPSATLALSTSNRRSAVLRESEKQLRDALHSNPRYRWNVRIKWPSWMEPVDSISDWLALSFGLIVLIAFPVGIASVVWKGVPFSGDQVGSWLNSGGGDNPSPWWACVDPTDACNWSIYRVQNDTRSTVVLRECDHRCAKNDHLGDPINLPPDAVSPKDAYVGVTALVDTHDWWLVQSASGRVLGCLVLDGHQRRRDDEHVLVSAARPCVDPTLTKISVG